MCRWIRLVVIATAISPVVCLQAADKTAPRHTGVITINLGDYATGDGTDETEAIQKAFDALPTFGHAETDRYDGPGGIMIIPRPEKYYAISDTIKVIEKWNTVIRCETPSYISRSRNENAYFRWIGPDNGIMFQFNSSGSIRVENLSLNAMDEGFFKGYAVYRETTRHDGWKPGGRLTRGVTGLLIGPKSAARGFQVGMVFDQLSLNYCAVGLRLGMYANNGPDVRELTFRGLHVYYFSDCGIIAASGNLANVTFSTLATLGYRANHAIKIDGGELLVLNWNGNNLKGLTPELSSPLPEGNSEVRINAGGIQVIKAWSEWHGPFLTTGTGYPEWTPGTGGSMNYAIILEGVRHYDGSWWGWKTTGDPNPVPVSIVHDRPVPLNLTGCAFWGEIQLGTNSQSIILDRGTLFSDMDCAGFTGEGVTRYGRVIHVGTRDPKNARILQPYVVDRRHTPGTHPPTAGYWQKGDGIINTDPDPTVAAKAFRGWVCIEAGEPGAWLPYGALSGLWGQGSTFNIHAFPSNRLGSEVPKMLDVEP